MNRAPDITADDDFATKIARAKELGEGLTTAIQASHLVLVQARAAGRGDVEAIVKRAELMLRAAQVQLPFPLDVEAPAS